MPPLADHRQRAVGHRRVLAVPRHRDDLTVRQPPVQRDGVAVVAGCPVAVGDLVAEEHRVGLLRDPHEALRARAHLVGVPVGGAGDDALDPVGLRDERLVVAAQVVELPLVEEDDAGEGGHAGARERSRQLVGLLVAVERPERGELGLRPGHELERRLRDDAERALVPHEQVLELVAGRRLPRLAPAAVADVHDLAVRQHHLERDDEVAHMAVAGADQAPPARPDAAADQRARVGGGVVGVVVPVTRAAPR